MLAANVTARRPSARSDKGSQKGNGDYIQVMLLHQGAEQSQEQGHPALILQRAVL